MVWTDLLFAHWPVDPDRIAPLLPRGMTVDTFDGRAWLGVVPFVMNRTRLRWLPPLPGTHTFPELNVRTYVTRDGEKPGVWFFSLDASNRLAVRGARATFNLPYFDARMSWSRTGDRVEYDSTRTHRGAPPASLTCVYEADGGPFRSEPGSLEAWLTERYCLYASNGRGRIRRGEIHHEPWPLRRARWAVERCEMTHLLPNVELNGEPSSLLMADRIEVIAWPPERVA